MIWILFSGALIVLIWYKFIKPLNYWENMGVNHTRPWPVLGDLWSNFFRRVTLVELTTSIYRMYPNARYIGCFRFTTPTLLLRDPELIKQLTVKDFEHFTDHRDFINPEVDPLLGSILVFLKGQRWREMRATLSGSFTSSKMKTMYHLMAEAAENFVQFFVDKNEDVIEVELKATYSKYTNDVIASAAFGIQCNSLGDPNNEFYQMGREIFGSGRTVSNTFKVLCYTLMPKLYKLFKLTLFNPKLGRFFRGIINETIKLREEKGIVRPDMINLLLESRKGVKSEEKEATETGFATVTESSYNSKVKKIQNISNELITSQAFVFFLAGFETVSTAMSFASYELALNKDCQDKLREEIKETYKSNNGKVTYDVLLKLKYLDMVITETLRMWPPATTTDRACTKPYTIEPVTQDEKPIHLKPGVHLWLPIHAIHRDPANYPNPDKFDPERFSSENKDNIKPYTYMPFGVGPRNCIGSRFALVEIKALLFNLLLNFEIVPSKKTQIPIKLSKKSQLPTSERGFWFVLKRIKQ